MFDDVTTDPYQVNPWDPNAEMAELRAMFDQIYGPEQGFTNDDRVNLRLLEQQAKNLAPVDFGRMGSAVIPGNPYSVDTRGLFTGLGNLVAAVINKGRQDKLYGNKEKSEAAGKKAEAIETRANVLDGSSNAQYRPGEFAMQSVARTGLSELDNPSRISFDPTSVLRAPEMGASALPDSVRGIQPALMQAREEASRVRQKAEPLRERQRALDPKNSLAADLIKRQEAEKRAALREQNFMKFMEQRYPEAYERLQRSNEMALTRKAQLEREKLEQDRLTERAKFQADAQKNREKSDQYRITASIMDRVANSTSGYKDAQFEYQNYQKQLQAVKKNIHATPEQKAELERLAGESKAMLDESRRAYNEALISLIEENGFKVPESVKKSTANLSRTQKDELLSSIYKGEWEGFNDTQKSLLRTAWDEGTLSTYLAQTGKIEQPQPIEEGIIDLTEGF